MDFALDEDEKALSELAGRICSERATPERLKAVEAEAAAGGDGLDRALWADLAAAGLVAAPLGEDNGGAGMGFLGACAVLEEIGRHVAAVPYLEVVSSALAIERFGSAELRGRLGAVGEGSFLVVPALAEPQADPRRPVTEAVAGDGGGFRLEGEKICVPAGLAAGGYLVPARLGDSSTAVVFVAAEAPGLERQRQETTTGRPEARLRLSSVEVTREAVLGGTTPEAGEVLGWLVDRVTAGLSVMAAGCLEEAVRITASYVSERRQFGRALASFQAVGQRAADAFIDTLGVRLTAWQAAWRLSAGLPAADEVTIAKYWASEAGQAVVHACQHLHGGIGMDRDYPVHRHFLLAKQIDLALGGAAPQLADLGRRIGASAPPA